MILLNAAIIMKMELELARLFSSGIIIRILYIPEEKRFLQWCIVINRRMQLRVLEVLHLYVYTCI